MTQIVSGELRIVEAERRSRVCCGTNWKLSERSGDPACVARRIRNCRSGEKIPRMLRDELDIVTDPCPLTTDP